MTCVFNGILFPMQNTELALCIETMDTMDGKGDSQCTKITYHHAPKMDAIESHSVVMGRSIISCAYSA